MPGKRSIRESGTEQVFEEALEHLRNLLRIDTTNPPGNEKKACEYIGTVLRKEKIPYEILESAPGRANLVARLSGDASRSPLLLNAHLDVVPVEREHWSHDPFGGEVDQGFVWGRGALDMKNMAAMSLMCLLLLHRRKQPLKRDLIFTAVADEEAGGTLGSAWLVENHPDMIRAEMGLGEFGGFSRIVDDCHFYPVQVAEKGICWLRIRARGEPGHGSLPNWEGSVGKIGEAAARLGKARLPFHLTRETREYVETLAAHQPFPKNRVLKQVLNPRLSRVVLERVLPDKDLARSLYAVLHNTANPTVIRAGTKVNVLPSEAFLEVDGRVLPGQTSDDFVREVRNVVGKGYEIEVLRYQPGVTGSPRDPILGYIADALRHHDPAAVVVPYMLPGFTDATHFSRLGIRCFGFSPVKLPANFNFLSLIHGHDERIPVEGFRFGLRVLSDLVSALCT